MQKTHVIGLVLALSSFSLSQAQSPDAQAQASSPAPIVQAYRGGNSVGYPTHGARMFDSEPNPGIFVRGDVANGVETVTATPSLTELRIVQGRADITVHHPADHSQILVDLPGGQVDLFKDGLYTFNAETRTVRVLHGEAEAFDGVKTTAKGTKVKETQQLAFFPNTKLKAVNAYPYELTADLLPGAGPRHGDGPYNGGGYGGYGEGFYGDYPFYAGGFGYPYGYGFGYPIGIGFYGGGFYGGGFRGGGFRGGFHR